MFYPLKIILILIVTIPLWTQAQNKCSAEEYSQFDFWVGDWNLTWKDGNGNENKGSNTITKTLNGCAIEENFSDLQSGFKGRSFSVYSPKKDLWQQTWVDNSGGYLVFTGGMFDGEMILNGSFVDKNGNNIQTRMVFKNINANSLDWSWERSADNGNTWHVTWLINYKRK